MPVFSPYRATPDPAGGAGSSLLKHREPKTATPLARSAVSGRQCHDAAARFSFVGLRAALQKEDLVLRIAGIHFGFLD